MGEKKRLSDIFFILGLLAILSVTAWSIHYHYIAATTRVPGFSEVDTKRIDEQIKGGNLNMHDALHYKRLP